MRQVISRFRLSSSAFERSDDESKIDPKRMIILSVEGDDTERTYFNHLNALLDSTIIQIEVLRHRHGDGYSAPQHVLELLNEYIDLREGQLIPEDLPDEFTKKYSKDVIASYVLNDGNISRETSVEIGEDLLKIGIDIEYRRYLKIFNKDSDYFAIVLDRDCGSHSRELMEECFNRCEEHSYGCYVTNPCFEFWLLLHLCNVKLEYSEEQLEGFKENKKVSNNHTMVSRELSCRVHHGKNITSSQFEKLYYPNISCALKNVKEFKTSYPELLDDIGSNLSQLFKIMGIE